MVNVKNKTCLSDGCKKQPTFNYEGETVRLFCSSHKQVNMINLNNKPCQYVGCTKIPNFNYVGQTVGLFCLSHKEINMIDVKHKTCRFDGCKKHPIFNYDGDTVGLFCLSHKNINMVNVKHKTCRTDNCKKRPSFGTHLTNKIHCSEHSIKGKEWRLNACYINNCKNIATYSEDGNKPYIYCMDHNPDEYKSIFTGKCSICGLSDLILDEEKKCLLTCTEKHSHRMKYSEDQMDLYFKRSNLKYIRDSIVKDGCDRRKRPDFVFDLGYGIVVVENDENQHKSRPCECEQIRMIQIHNEYGGLPVHFIRFNPDRYSINEMKEDRVMLSTRLSRLVDNVKNIIATSETFFVKNNGLSVVYLYYDGYNNKDYSIIDIKY